MLAAIRRAFSQFGSLLKLNEPRAHMVVMSLAFAAIGLTLIFQAGRYYNTPSYANLLAFLPAVGWGGIYCVGAILKALTIWRFKARKLLYVSHTFSIILLSWWELAFIFRWLTDNGTTIVNVTTWALMLYLTTRSALMVDEHIVRGE